MTQVLGLGRDELSYENLVEVLRVQAGGSLFESELLDYKSKLHDTAEELAKDVTAFANRRGGIIVFGVKDRDEGAGRLTHVALGREVTTQQRRLNQAAQPPVTSLEWRAVESPQEEGRGLLLLIIDPSPLAPHAVSVKSRISYHWRQGREVRLMQEGDIERAYRHRFEARSQVADTLERARGWVADEEGCLYVAACPTLSQGRIYGAPSEGVEQFERARRSDVVKLHSSYLGSYVRTRFNRVTGTAYRDDDGEGEKSEVAAIDRFGAAAMKVDLGDLSWLKARSGYESVDPKRVHPKLSHATSDVMLLEGVVMLLVGVRELYREFGVGGAMLLEFGLNPGGATLFTVGFRSATRRSWRVSDEAGSFRSEVSLSDLHHPPTFGRLISDIHQDVLGAFDVRRPAVADEDGRIDIDRLTPERYQREPKLWEAKGLMVRSEAVR
ncbi:MAG: ATP-binding protein [Planctomycetota bacterium]